MLLGALPVVLNALLMAVGSEVSPTQLQRLMSHVLCHAAVGGLAGDTVPSTPDTQTTPEGTPAQTTPLGTATQTPSGISLRAAGARSLFHLQDRH